MVGGVLKAYPVGILAKKKYMCPTLVGELGWWCGKGVFLVGEIREVILGYLSCSAGVSCRMLSHACGNWYFQMFLFSEGSFTWMNMASLMFLDVPCVSLCMMLKHSALRWVAC